MLMTEKHVSSTYNTAILNSPIKGRDILNHIQKEEQQHGEAIFKYMETKACTSHSKYGKVLPFPLHKLIDNQQISVILYNHKKFQAGVYETGCCRSQ